MLQLTEETNENKS